VQAKVAREAADREKHLFEQKISAERDWRAAEAEATRARADRDAAAAKLRALGAGGDGGGSTLSITAPLDGLVVERNTTLGQVVGPADTLFVVMDLHEVWLLVDVYEQDLSQVKVGQKVEARVAAVPDHTFTGTVANIGAVIEPHSRATKVRVVIPNDGAEGARPLKPGMFATVELTGTTGQARERLYVPTTAVQRDGNRRLVFVVRGEREYEAREVQIGREVGDAVAVDEGLTEGETVVTDGSFNLKAELKRSELGGED
jgi:cobalt-zinc-cadmium efflux system membrane fusion protein